jgi:BirA family biotin operon repressor/biotin-[acetyl-CoA-carboxylase] ligase
MKRLSTSHSAKPSSAMNFSHVILGMLYDRRDGYFSVEEFALATGRPRAAVDRALSMLRQGGVEMELSPANGIRLHRPAGLHPSLIERELGTTRVGRNVICFPEVASTNDVAMDSARQVGADGLVVMADSQRSGRGRLGRRWISPPGANILMSVLLVDAADKLAHEAVTIAAGLAVAEGIEASCRLACQLKWPNDVLLDERKVSGILVELGKAKNGRAIVIGIGVNANAAPPDGAVDRPADSLARHVGGAVERVEVVRAILRRLDHWLAEVEAGRHDGIHSAWMAHCSMINQRIAVTRAGRRYEGRVLDVSPLEGLILIGDHGQRIHFPAESSSLEP